MKSQTIKTPSGKIITFIPGTDYMSILQTEDYMAFDFELHPDRNDATKAIAFREFHIYAAEPLIRNYEQALLNYCLSFGLFELCYEDGIPCLTHTFNIKL
jgi:hypothetical protein